VAIIKLYLDADITAGPFLASTLSERGFDVVSAVSVGNDGLDDRAQLDYALAQNRVLLTFNIKDFIPLAQELYAQEKEFPGLVVSPQIKGDKFSYLLRLVLNLLNKVDESSMHNTVRYLQEFE